MATIRKRGAYQWQAMIRKKGVPAISKTFEIKADAEKWVRQTEREIDLGSFQDRTEAENTTLTEALERYLKEVSSKKAKTTKDGEYSKAKTIKKYPIASYSLSNIRGKHVAEYRDERMAVVKNNTVRLELALISHLFTIAVQEWGMPIDNPVKSIKKPSVADSARERRVIEEELPILLKQAETQREWMRPIIEFAIETCMRRSEITSMKWEYFDLKKRTVFIPKNIAKNREARTVPLSSKAYNIILELRKVQRIDGFVWGIHKDTVTKQFAEVTKKAGIIDLTFHDLRHEGTSRLFERGDLNIMEVASVTGHKDLAMLKRYTHLYADKIAKKLG